MEEKANGDQIETLLLRIVSELQGLKGEQQATNRRLDETNARLDETNRSLNRLWRFTTEKLTEMNQSLGAIGADVRLLTERFDHFVDMRRVSPPSKRRGDRGTRKGKRPDGGGGRRATPASGSAGASRAALPIGPVEAARPASAGERGKWVG